MPIWSKSMTDADKLEAVLRYHERTKHRFDRYAAGPGRLDWRNQPDPFRRYAGAGLLRLPLPEASAEASAPRYGALYRRGAVAAEAPALDSLSMLLWCSLALSAWKQAGTSRWSLRCNPSSGNLHPTEGYVLIGAIDGLADSPGLYHYAPLEHALERRADYAQAAFDALMCGLPEGAFVVALSSIHWREAWKYGERAFRYCQHDVGHAVAALRIAAATLGWRAVVLDDVADSTLERLLGLDRDADYAGAEREEPELAMAVWPARGGAGAGATATIRLDLEAGAAGEPTFPRWHGTANRLSRGDPVRWDAIGEVAVASRKPAGDARVLAWHEESPSRGSADRDAAEGPLAVQIIRRRRSLLACDGRTSIAADRFYAMLARSMPCVERPVAQRPMPWDSIPWDPAIDLALFVHRVDGIVPGLYALARNPQRLDVLKRSMHASFAWSEPPGCPPDLPLRLLLRGDATQLATQVSCWQEIAGDGAFSLGMLAEYRRSLVANGPWFYRRLFREAGLIGQLLYLEAEAAGVRGTGIGCFFDDPVHQVFGLDGIELQSLYHFTVGAAVADERLTTLPAYGGGAAASDVARVSDPVAAVIAS